MVAWILLYKKILIQRLKKKEGHIHKTTETDVGMIEAAEKEILKLNQRRIFLKEIEALQSHDRSVKGSISIYKLEPSSNQDGLVSVGRLFVLDGTRVFVLIARESKMK